MRQPNTSKILFLGFNSQEPHVLAQGYQMIESNRQGIHLGADNNGESIYCQLGHCPKSNLAR